MPMGQSKSKRARDADADLPRDLHQEVGEHPTAGAVTHVMGLADAERIEDDVEDNLKLWGLMEALRNGYLPSNAQLDLALTKVGDLIQPERAKNGDTEKALEALVSLSRTLRKAIRQKNSDQLIQDTAYLAFQESRGEVGERITRRVTKLPSVKNPPWEIKEAPGSRPVIARQPSSSTIASGESSYTTASSTAHDPEVAESPRSAKEVKGVKLENGARQGELFVAARHVRTLGMIFATNSELRAAMGELVAIARDMAKKADKDEVEEEKKRAKKARKEKEKEEREREKKEKPVANGTAGKSERDIKSASTSPQRSTWSEWGAGQFDLLHMSMPSLPSLPSPISRRSSRRSKTPPAALAPEEEDADADEEEEEEEPTTTTDEDDDDPGGPAPQPPGAFFADADDHEDVTWADIDTGDDAHKQGQESVARAEAAKKDPRTAKFIGHLKIAVASLQDQDGYAEAMEWLMDMFKAYEEEVLQRETAKGALSRMAKAGERKVKGHDEVPEAPVTSTPTRQILANFVTIMERFARGRSTNPIQKAIADLYADVFDDDSAMKLWRDVDRLIANVLLKKGYLGSDECAEKAEDIWTRMMAWLKDGVYRAHWNALCFGVSYWLGWKDGDPEKTERPWFRDDPITAKLQDDAHDFASALFLDRKGRLSFKPAIWQDVFNLVFPALTQGGGGFFPIPRMEFASPNVELVLENVYLSISNILPTMITIEEHRMTKLSPFDAIKNTHRNRNKIRISQVQADVRDAMIWVKFRKLKIQDQGDLDITLARQGLSITLDLEFNTDENAKRMLTVHDVDVNIDQMSLRVRNSTRDRLFRAVLPTIGVPFLKSKLTAVLERKIRVALERANAEMMEIRRRLDKATPEAKLEVKDDDSATQRLYRIVAKRGQEIKKEMDAAKAVKRKRTERLRSESIQRHDAAGPESPASTPSSSTSEVNLPDAGDFPRAPIDKKKAFKISARLEEALLPHLSADAERSIVYRRWRAEESSRRANGAALAIERTTAGVVPTATGLRGGAGGKGAQKLWWSPVFNWDWRGLGDPGKAARDKASG